MISSEVRNMIDHCCNEMIRRKEFKEFKENEIIADFVLHELDANNSPKSINILLPHINNWKKNNRIFISSEMGKVAVPKEFFLSYDGSSGGLWHPIITSRPLSSRSSGGGTSQQHLSINRVIGTTSVFEGDRYYFRWNDE